MRFAARPAWLPLALALACTPDAPRPAPQAVDPEQVSAAPATSPRTTGAQPPDPAEAPSGTADRGSYKRTRKMMGTIISMTVLDQPESTAAPAVDAAFREMEGLEAILSEWQPDSEISRINRAAGDSPVPVGEHTMAVVKAGIEVSRWSGGAFDLSWAALRGLYRFAPGEQEVPQTSAIAQRLPLIDYRDIVIDDEASTVFLKRPGMTIGTGGIAKGYALDRAAAILDRAGIENFMFFGGGQIQVRGTKHGRPWRVGIQHPRRQDHFAFVEATGGSISTSGDYEHAFIRNGKRWHHILDPRTGMPVAHTASVTVVADSGLYADAVSTAVFVLGPSRAMKLLPTAPGNPEVAIVDAGLKLITSRGMEPRLRMSMPVKDGQLPP